MAAYFNVQISAKCKLPSTAVEKSFFLILRIHCDLQGHLRSKVKVPNESQIMTSYLKEDSIFKISAIHQFDYFLFYLIFMA